MEPPHGKTFTLLHANRSSEREKTVSDPPPLTPDIFGSQKISDDEESEPSASRKPPTTTRIPLENADDDDDEESVDLFRFCETCLVLRGLRTKHCSSCGRCVDEFDHHCIWINNCVGRDNHRAFMGFLFCTLGGLVGRVLSTVKNSGGKLLSTLYVQEEYYKKLSSL